MPAGELNWSSPSLLLKDANIERVEDARNRAGDVALGWVIGSDSSAYFQLRRFVKGAWADGTFLIDPEPGSDIRFRRFFLGVESSGVAVIAAQAFIWYEETRRTDNVWRFMGEDSSAGETPALFRGASDSGYPIALHVSESDVSSVIYAARNSDTTKFESYVTERDSTGWTAPQSIGVIDGMSAYAAYSSSSSRGDFVLAIAPQPSPANTAAVPIQAILRRAGAVSGVGRIALPHPLAGEVVSGVDDAGAATLLFRLNEPDGPRVYATRAAPESSEWSTPQRISEASASLAFLSMTHSGDTLALWFAGENGSQSGPIVASELTGGAWAKPHALTQTVASTSARIAENAGGSRLLVWTQPGPGEKLIRHLLFQPSSGWGAVGTVTSYKGDALLDHVSLDDDGRALVVWRETGSDVTVYDLKWSRSL